MAHPENGLGSLYVIGNNVQNLTSIIKDAAPLTFAQGLGCVVFSMDVGGKWWAHCFARKQLCGNAFL